MIQVEKSYGISVGSLEKIHAAADDIIIYLHIYA